MRGTKEFENLAAQFEQYAKKHLRVRLDREDPKMRPVAGVPVSVFYQSGDTDNLFHAYMAGYAYGKAQENLNHERI